MTATSSARTISSTSARGTPAGPFVQAATVPSGPLSLSLSFLVIPGHRAPAGGLVLRVVCRHPGGFPPAGSHQCRQLNPALDQVLGHADAASRFEAQAMEAGGWLETALFTAMAVN